MLTHPDSLISQAIANAFLEEGEIKEHVKMLTDTYADMCVVALTGIGKRIEEFDSWQVY